MGKLTGKTAIITGASAGIGRATAYAFAREGCNLVLTARREERLREVAERCAALGARAVYHAGDAREEATAAATVALAVETFGQVDILINNAGIGRVLPLTESTMEDYDLIMDTNVRSAFAFTLHTIPDMLKRKAGLVVMVSSVTGVYGHVGETIYSASKFALRGLAQAIDKELRTEGIKSCVMCPSATITEFEVGYGRTEERLAKSGHLTADDVAEAILFVSTQSERSRVFELRMASLSCDIF